MRLLAFLPVFLMLAACREESAGSRSSATGPRPAMAKTIPLTELQEMFAHTSETTDWDMKGPLVWGYFFTDAEKAPLEPLRDELVAAGYRFVNLDEAMAEGAGAKAVWMLHVEKEEIHTPETLHARNQEFYAMVKRLGVDAYDGMDVGPTGAEEDPHAPETVVPSTGR